MADVEIRVLGRVDIVIDRRPQKIAPQEAQTLAVLVAAGGPVRRDALVSAIWEDDEIPEADGLSPIISRLRAKLRRGGLDVRFARELRGYELAEVSRGTHSAAVDAHRFVAHVRQGRELLERGSVAAALDVFLTAASGWGGGPFDTTGRDWTLPGVCCDFRDRLEKQRAYLVRSVAQLALRSGRYEDAAFLASASIGIGQGDTDAVWLLRFLVTLRDEGVAAAEEVIVSRRERIGHDDAVSRACDLLAAHDDGVDVHQRQNGVLGEHGRGSPGIMIGRQREIAVAASLLDRVAAGSPALLAIRGAAGVGKTRLLRELAQLADGTRVQMDVITCQELDDLQPWRFLIGTLWACARRDLSTGPGPLRPAEYKILTDFLSAAAVATPAPPGRERDPEQLASMFCKLLLLIARGRGLLVVFDNVHLFSPVAHDLLGSVRRRLGHVPVGFVLAGRPGEGWRDIPELSRDIIPPLLLSALRPKDVHQWLDQMWDREPTGAEVAEVVRVTGGLPLRLCEVTEAGRGPAVLLELRPGQSSDPLLWLAAAAITSVGQEIDTTLVAQMLGLDEEEADRQQVAAVATRVVESHDGVRFRHDIRREEVLADVERDPAFTRWLHARAFAVFGERTRSPGWVDPALPVRRARHARAAGRDLPQKQVAAACLDAARAEMGGFGTDAAVVWAETGLRLPCESAIRVGLLITLGDARADIGDMHEAGQQYLQAYYAAESQNLPAAQAAAAIQLARRWSDPGQVDHELLQIIRSSLAALEDNPDEDSTALRLRLRAHLAHKLTMAVPQDSPEAGIHIRPGVALARDTLRELAPDYDPAVRCEVLNECRWGLYDFAAPAELVGIAEQLHDASIRARSVYFRSEALVALAIDQLRLGRVPSALSTVNDHRRYVAQNHRPLGRWLQNTLDIVLDLWFGRFDAAARRISGESQPAVEELEASLVVPAGTLRQTWMGQVYWLLREQGKMADLFGSGMADGVEQHGYFPIWTAGLVLAHCEAGHYDEAVDGLTALVDEMADLAALPPHGWAVPTLSLLAESCVALTEAQVGTHEIARLIPLLRGLLAGHADEIALAGWPTVLIGPVARFSGILALAAGDSAEALRYFDRADRLIGSSRPHRARLRLDRAKAVLLDGGFGAGREATDLARKALRTAESLGMALLAVQAQAVLDQAS
ncbi:AAA family ATPase [Frankia sp. Cr2]|uniref:AAA family ATPase n=1 Tax=Frankia sp. Cr2 TaxID=3073932 RepID=UPI002AD4719F|nr:AAA family ATPase [Frankia sp. Cr2]